MTDRDPFAAAPPELRELLALASDLALQAGRIHDEGRRQVLTIETKSSPTDLVSQIDKAAERLIVDRLRTERPDDAILGEEGTSRPGTSGVRWVVDPLDGTTNYIYGYPAYSVSIAAEVGGDVQVGVVLDSSSGRLYRAVAGAGAVCDDRAITVRVPESLGTALVATGFSYSSVERELEGVRGVRGAAAHPGHPPQRVRGARPLPPRRRRGGRLLGARPLAVGLRGRRADRPRGRRRGAACAVRRRQGPRRGRHARVAHAGVLRAAARGGRCR